MNRDLLDNAIEALWSFIVMIAAMSIILIQVAIPVGVLYTIVHFAIKFW